MSGKRQHFLPRFLLRGFASRTSGDETYSWVFRKNSELFETNIVNIGVSKDFYGSAQDQPVDAQITELESKFAISVEELRRKKKTARIDDISIPDFVVHLAIRTKHLRDSFLESSDHLMQRLFEFLEDPLNLVTIMRKELRRNPNFVKKRLEEALNGVDLPEAYKRPLVSLFEKFSFTYIEENIGAATPIFSYLSKELHERLPAAIKQGHITTLAKAAVPEPRAIEYRKLHWFLITPTESDLILGDLGSFTAIRPRKRFKLLPEQGDILEAVYLPISSRHLIVGSAEDIAPAIDTRELNTAIASCSREFFIGSQRDLGHEYAIHVGENAYLISVKDLEGLSEKLFSDLMK